MAELQKARVKCIVHLLRQCALYTPLALIIGKFQYMDLGDWAIAKDIAKMIHKKQLHNVSMMLCGWPMDTRSMTYLVSSEEREVVSEYHELRDSFCDTTLRLPKWNKLQCREFLQSEFDIDVCSKRVLQFIVNKTDGIPGMVKTLVHDDMLVFLKHGGHLDCSMIEKCGDLEMGFRHSDINLSIPYAIQSFYTKMLDSLDQFSLLTIKCSSVISVGQEFLSVTFSYDMLYNVHPLSNSSNNGGIPGSNFFKRELHKALNTLEMDEFVTKFDTENKRLTGLSEFEGKHNNTMYYVFSSGYLRDVTYSNMLYKQRSAIHKKIYDLLDKPPFNVDVSVQQSIRRHKLLSVQDGFYHHKSEIEEKREVILGKKKSQRSQQRTSWMIPECVFILFLGNVTNLDPRIKKDVYVSIHGHDDKQPKIVQSSGVVDEYLCVTLKSKFLNEIEDESLGPVLAVRLWLRNAYKRDTSIGKFSLKLHDLYESQLNKEQTQFRHLTSSLLDSRNDSGKSRMESSRTKIISHNNTLYENQQSSLRSMPSMSSREDLLKDPTNFNSSTFFNVFVGYKMQIFVKEKKQNKFKVEKPLYLEAFVKFVTIDDDPRADMRLNMQLNGL